MNKRGFTLIEVIVVTALIGILLSIAAMQFSDYLRKGAIERQTEELYADLMTARAAAVTQRSSVTVAIIPTVITFSGGGLENTARKLSAPVSASTASIVFDERGTYNIDEPDANAAICVSPSMESAQYDSIVVYSTKIQLGKVAYGGACTSANVTVK